MLLVPTWAWCVPPDTVISNTAQATYTLGMTAGIVSSSNTVTTTTVVVRTPSALEFLQYAPTASGAELVSVPVTECRTTGRASVKFVALPSPVPCGSDTPIYISNYVPLVLTNLYHTGDPIFIRLTDQDQNLNPLAAETVLVNIINAWMGDSELLRLTETGVSTGVFVGYIQSGYAIPATKNDGICTTDTESEVVVHYVDSQDGTDTAMASSMVDPYGVVFDSTTGLPVDGVTVTLINTMTGLPANVYGDDGVSIFAATVTSGGTTTDSGGNIYDFPPGEYRFPFVTPGTYRLDVVPPSGYDTPSSVPTATLQALPGGPFAIIEPGSRGEPFILNPGPAFHIDFPIDPVVTSLWVTKSASQDMVSIGDFLRYSVNVQNTTADVMSAVTLTDRLPLGFRYRTGSLEIDGISSPDPTISPDGYTLTLFLSKIAGNTTAAIRYVVEVAAGARPGSATNSAFAEAAGGVRSNIAGATVRVKEELFRSKCFIMGRVIADNCDNTFTKNNQNNDGVEGVRLYLEDGTYVVTDDNGMFHFEGVRQGVHVVQLDLDSLPEKYEVVPSEENSRFAGRSYSQFVDLQGGTMWRTDFHVALKPKIKDEVRLEITSTLQDDLLIYEFHVQGGKVPLRNMRLMIMLPDESMFVSNSSTLNENSLSDPTVTSNVLNYGLGDVADKWDKVLRFRAKLTLNDDSRELHSKGVLFFDTPSKKNQRTPLVENVVLRISEEEQIPQEEKVLILVPETELVEFVVRPHFASLRSELNEESQAMLDELVKKLRSLDLGNVEVTGHTDSIPIRARNRHIYADNYALSLARARSVGKYLLDNLDIDPSRLTIEGKGPDEPIASNRTAEGRALNRCVTIQIKSEKIREYGYSPNVTDTSDNRNFEPPSTHVSEKERAALDNLVNELQHLEMTHLFITYVVGPSNTTIPGEQKRFLNKGTETVYMARARSIARYLSVALGLSPAQVTVVRKGSENYFPDDKNAKSGVRNGHVAVRVLSKKINRRTSLKLIKSEDRTVVETEGLRSGETWDTSAAQQKDSEQVPVFDQTWLEAADPGLEWLEPGPECSPSIPSLKLAVKHDPRHALKLLLDGSEVEPLNFESIRKNKSGTVAVSRWRGVDLHEGDNCFELIIYDTSRTKIDYLKRVVHYSGPPVHAEVVKEQSNLVADGRHTPVIAVRLTDKDGYTVREGIIGNFSVDAPHAAEEELDALQKNLLSGMDKEKPHYVVGKNGIALVRLQSTTRSGEALVRIPMADDEEEELRAWLKPESRDWIIVGLAEGTIGYNTVTGHMEHANEADVDENLYKNGRIAFFAKGKIKGEWLMTMAYDNKKTKKEVGNSLHQTIDPDTFYTLYGDAAEQKYDAASARKLYLKIERDQFYALFGDFETGLTVTELSRYSRSLNGFKSELKTNNYDFNLFASETNQAFVKDEIRSDGTSGLYQLSRKNIVINSEKIVTETRDRFRSEVIISTTSLTRHIDYNIDYDAGTLFFREPIYSKDENLNPVFIVVEYESYDATDEDYTYGGRGAVKLLNKKLEIGATYIHEGSKGAKGDLGGLDAKIDFGTNTQLRAEIATTETDVNGVETKGDAYLAEVTHHSSNFKGQLYIREQGEGFGLGQQNGSEAGTRKIGADASYRFSKEFNASGEAYRHFNLDTDAERDLGEATVNYTGNRTTVHAGLRHAEDRLVDGTVNRSDQIIAGASRRMFSNRLQLRLDREQSLGANDDNPDFPTRTIIGADYKMTESVVLFGEQELTQGENEDTQGTRLGMKATPWSGGHVNTSIERQFNEYGPRAFANLGLKQTWNLNEKWGVDAGLDHSRTVEKPGNTPFNVNAPPSSGSDYDFTALSIGATYKEKHWSWASRVEFRYGENENKWGITTGIYSEPVSGIGLSTGAQILRTEADRGSDTTDADIRFGLAYRPKNTRWIILDRLDLKFNKQEDSDSNLENWRIVNNMNANFKPNRKTQISLQYGLKYVEDIIDGDHYSGYTDLIGVEGRYDLTKRWDVGLRTSVLHSWRADQIDYSSGVSLGCNVIKNAWLSIGYNFIGFEDEDFSRAGFTAKGPFIQFRFKFDQESVRDALKGFVRYHE